MDCIGRTYNIFMCLKATGSKQMYTSINNSDWRRINNWIKENNWIKDITIVQDSTLWLSPFEYFLNKYLVKEIEDTLIFFKGKQDPRYSKLIQSITKLLHNVERPHWIQTGYSGSFGFDDDLLNVLFERAENEAELTEEEKKHIESFREEIERYEEEFVKVIEENEKYDFLKNLFLCEIDNIKIILENFDKVRPEYMLSHWGSISLNILTYCYDLPILLEASGKINSSIFNFVKTYGTPIVCEKLIENATQIFSLLSK